ncbi:MAG: hypothetical protein M9920_00135 [Verrucomicrobiae bacterium]|nr:hypothetical protein [Verrucomicrobiae bacterium]
MKDVSKRRQGVEKPTSTVIIFERNSLIEKCSIGKSFATAAILVQHLLELNHTLS